MYYDIHKIKYKIIKINTIIGESLPFESKFIIDDSIQKNNNCYKFHKLYINAFYESLEKIKTSSLSFNDNDDYNNLYLINKNIKLFINNYSGMQYGYYFNGNIKYEFYHINGKIEGLYKEYDFKSNLYKECMFTNGKKNGYYKFYNDNYCYKELQFIDDKLNGTIKYFYNDLQIEKIETYRVNIKDGIFEEYYKNGMIKKRYYYKNNKIDGKYEKYEIDSNGNHAVKIACIYKNGRKW